jgi:hypothetical protein
METPNKKTSCVFAYYVNNEFQGFRADSMGTRRKDFAKVYTYSPEQVAIIKDNTKHELGLSGTAFMKLILSDEPEMIEQVNKGEKEKREWGEFELRVYLWIDREQFYEMCTPGEEWKRDKIIEEMLNATPLEVHKFKTMENHEN